MVSVRTILLNSHRWAGPLKTTLMAKSEIEGMSVWVAKPKGALRNVLSMDGICLGLIYDPI